MSWIKISTSCLIICFCNVISISLNGKWTGYVLSTGNTFTAKIPSGVYSDLEKSGLISKNLLGFNDLINRWVANETIIYAIDIEASNTFLESSHIVLIFHGLDTFTKIFINDVEVGKTSNMFLRYSFDIKSYLKNGVNELKIVFESPVKVAEKFYNLQSLNYVIPPKCVPKEYNGECHVNHIRKMQASFGWDWGPGFPSMGIWKNVELKTTEDILLSEISIDVLKKNSWEINVTVFFDVFNERNTVINNPIHIICTLENYMNHSIITNLKVTNNQVNKSTILNVPLNDIEPWWPNGYGEQKLYLLRVKIENQVDMVERTFKIGFRTVELVQDPLKKGLSFYFKVNGIPIFAKGSNWIPPSIFPEKIEEKEKVQHLLQSAKDTHMNMLRVWGGGVYESDFFYSLADEHGIMIWQDFMFACNMYPSTKSFLNDVKKEVTQNMRRLKYHPSIVLWAGNNENEAALYGNWYGTGSKQIYKDDYVKLYVDTIKDKATLIDTTRPFMVSSPSNGLYSEQRNYTESNPYSNFYGDVHYYNYLKNSWDINQYPITRFASEYGFQALPSIWTMISAIETLNDLQLNSSFMNHRQHLPNGNLIMSHLINKNFVIPSSNNTIRALMDYIYLSQITQAVSMRMQTELYRQMKSSFNSLGEGLTMGALYWQLNDVWQAPSWSSIDFEGHWKMLHYYANDFFSPLIITSKITEADELLIYIVSDFLTPLTNLIIEINVYEWKSSKNIQRYTIFNITLDANESKLVKEYWIDVLLESAGCGSIRVAKKNCFLELILKDMNNKRVSPINYVYPSSLKDISLPDDYITVRIQPKDYSNKYFEIEITSQNIALFVWLEVGNVKGRFSENGFHILQGKKIIDFHAFKPIKIQYLNKNIIVTSLSRIYNTNLRMLDAQIVVDRLNTFN